MSVAKYFKETGRPLKHPHLPCVNVGRHEQPTYVPIERCTLSADQRRMKLDARQSAEMISLAKEDPRAKQQACAGKVGLVAETLEDQGTDQLWGLSVGRDMLHVQGRVLPPPVLEYGRGEAYNVGASGSWNVSGLKFKEPGTIKSWAVAVLLMEQEVVDHNQEGSIHAYLDEQRRMMQDCGMQLPSTAPPVVYQMPSAGADEQQMLRGGNYGGRQQQQWQPQQQQQQQRQPKGIEDTMNKAVKAAERLYGAQPDILLVVLPEKLVDEYKEVKRVSDIELGIPSQVVAGNKAKVGPIGQFNSRAGGPQYWANVALKINTKVGGVNSTLLGNESHLPVLGGPSARPFMVMGADVSHPTVLGRTAEIRAPSVAAVVASTDRTLGRWATRVLLQPGRQEVIGGMAAATKELLLQFQAVNRNKKPERIVMYRDGVAEGQFEQVVEQEFVAIVQACSEVEPGYRPDITFIVVQKNHNTRLLPVGGPGSTGSDFKGNVLPGTVVDGGIVSPAGHDFYLNSHAGLQGTNKPAHYHVLIDEIGFGADGVQLVTYWMCYLFQRATKSVSYCPPAYYADRAAFRGRTLLAATSSESGSDAGSLRAGSTSQQQTPQFSSINKALRNSMYYL
ncbi:Protein argonaute-3 [Pleodorina starrii]|nr:Protein argonaute-3 [Pleodorina starrii]